MHPVPSSKDYRSLLSKVNLLSEPHERLYLALVGYTGLRRGEILALRWIDISFSDESINVRHAVNTRTTSVKTPGTVKEPKTVSGIRTVPLCKALKEILLSNRHEHEFIISDSLTGEPLHTESKFNTMWRNIKRQIDIGPYTSHSFRHAMCSSLLAGGVDIKTTQAILGNAQASTTLDVCAHATPSTIQNAALLFNSYMSN